MRLISLIAILPYKKMSPHGTHHRSERCGESSYHYYMRSGEKMQEFPVKIQKLPISEENRIQLIDFRQAAMLQ